MMIYKNVSWCWVLYFDGLNAVIIGKKIWVNLIAAKLIWLDN